MNLLKLAKLLPALKEGLRLSRALESRTTKEQWKGTAIMALIICVIIAIIKTQIAAIVGDIPEEVWLGVATAALAALGPIMSRISAFASSPALKLGKNADMDAIRVKVKNADAWKSFCGTMSEALAQGYDVAVDLAGGVYDLKKCEYTGTVRLSTGEIKRYEEQMEKNLYPNGRES